MSQTTQAAAVAACPRCRKPLVDPAGLGWCKECGYCRSLEDGAAPVVETTRAPAPTRLAATGEALGSTPIWFWVTLLGIGVVVGGTYAAGTYLRLTPFHRALFTTVQLGSGLLVMFIGQFIGLLRVAPEEATLSFKDAIFPFKLYPLVMKRLPSTQLTIYLGAWGLAAMLAAGIFIGGLGHWLTYLPASGAQKNVPVTKR